MTSLDDLQMAHWFVEKYGTPEEQAHFWHNALTEEQRMCLMRGVVTGTCWSHTPDAPGSNPGPATQSLSIVK